MPSPAGPMLELHGSLHHGGSVATPVCHSRGGFKALLRSVLRKGRWRESVCAARVGWGTGGELRLLFLLHSIRHSAVSGTHTPWPTNKTLLFTAGNMHKNAVDGK